MEEDLLSTGRQQVFKIEALVAATNNFHKNNEVGEGGAGTVYKGTTHDGKQIAVKKMSFTSDEGRKAFMNEKLLAEVQHRNLVNLLGSCEQESQGFLVYEYFPNKSLDKFLSNTENRKGLDWHRLYNIIQGIARGLLYLHEDSQVRIVHRDIKPSNILLDEKLNPKIADFGTAKIFPEDKTHVIATRTVGTFGYMPLEYINTGKFSERTDVYSFGIVLLELVTGEKISSDAFLERVWRSYKKKKFVPTIDPTMTKSEKAKALRCIQVGLLCIQEDLLRPTISQVITMLSTSENLRVPKKPLFQTSTARSWKLPTLPSWKIPSLSWKN